MEEIVFEFGGKKSPIRISLKEYQGRKLCDIRKFYTSAKDEILPSRKGISLNPFQLNRALSIIKDNKGKLEGFFATQVEETEFNLEVEYENMIGRGFNVVFEGNSSIVQISPQLFNGLSENEQSAIGKLLQLFYLTLIEQYEDDEVSHILDSLNAKLSKTKW